MVSTEREINWHRAEKRKRGKDLRLFFMRAVQDQSANQAKTATISINLSFLFNLNDVVP